MPLSSDGKVNKQGVSQNTCQSRFNEDFRSKSDLVVSAHCPLFLSLISSRFINYLNTKR